MRIQPLIVVISDQNELSDRYQQTRRWISLVAQEEGPFGAQRAACFDF